ncbi:hypothetical protein AB0H43_13255 [Hamadaea sp. NPDC050747]|uniref:hypothetical protein n=1 Tax=Hamadaea sp. NPDC050747 TaxID=3155789 RepID=UPI00340DE395
MKTVRYTAAIATIIMALLNLPFALDDGDIGLPTPVRWLFSLLGVAGLVAAVALFRSATWAAPAVAAVGAANLIAAVVGLAKSWDGSVIGLVLSAVAVALAATYAVRRPTRA